MEIHNPPKIHWENNIVFSNRIPEVFSRDYFLLLLKALYLPEGCPAPNENKFNDKRYNYDNEESILEEETYKNAHRHKTEFYIDTIIINSKNYYIIGKNVTIKETMLFFRGRSLMVFYLPTGPYIGFQNTRFSWFKNRLFYDMILDSGKFFKNLVASDDNNNLDYQIVMTLIKSLSGKGYHNFYDSWYGSIYLIKDLSEKGYEIITFLRVNAKNLPNKIDLNNSSKKYVYNNNSH